MGRRVIFQFSRLRLSDLFVPGSIIPLKCMGWAIMSRGEAKGHIHQFKDDSKTPL